MDKFIYFFDSALRTLFPPKHRVSERANPAELILDSNLTQKDLKLVQSLMKINHAGEVCAQALYQGQALTARDKNIMQHMVQSSKEEIDHLAWCEARLLELNAKTSYFNPIWYVGSFFLGALAGLINDRVSLGFVAETERQVSEHLNKHLNLLPLDDKKTRAILKQMQQDEEDHANKAINAGALELPIVIKFIMRQMSKIMIIFSS